MRYVYRRSYHYPHRWAIAAEIAWRLEHGPVRAVRLWAYPIRKTCERRGSALR